MEIFVKYFTLIIAVVTVIGSLVAMGYVTYIENKNN